MSHTSPSNYSAMNSYMKYNSGRLNVTPSNIKNFVVKIASNMHSEEETLLVKNKTGGDDSHQSTENLVVATPFGS